MHLNPLRTQLRSVKPNLLTKVMIECTFSVSEQSTNIPGIGVLGDCKIEKMRKWEIWKLGYYGVWGLVDWGTVG